MVSSANWETDDQNSYRQFAELSWKNQNWLKEVRRSEVQLIGLLKSVQSRCCLFHTATSTALKTVNRFTNSKVKKY